MLSTLPGEAVPAPLTPWSAEEIFSLAAESQVNARKPHQGVTGKKVGLHQGPTVWNSTTALGVSWRLSAGTMPGATVTYEYDGFGNKINSTGTTPNNFLYRGEAYDSDLGLYYLRARYYNPLTGRFMSRDPEDGKIKDPRTLHKYLYAGGDPVNRIDPRGRDSWDYSSILAEETPKTQLELRATAYAVRVALCVAEWQLEQGWADMYTIPEITLMCMEEAAD